MMEDLKAQIQRKLIADILVDKLKNCESVIFKESWCTQERIIRFTTPLFRDIFSANDNSGGRWNTGDSVMYEVLNDIDMIRVDCILSTSFISYSQNAEIKKLLKALDIDSDTKDTDGEYKLGSWTISFSGDINDAFKEFDSILENKIPNFEDEISGKHNHIKDESLNAELIKEGEVKYNLLSKYERNPKARKECLEYYGTACSVCGIDFGKTYGPEFAGKIEVHHIVPLSQIKSEYIVDPIKDLIPVCPNCHAALHSKKDGVYTVEELKNLMRK